MANKNFLIKQVSILLILTILFSIYLFDNEKQYFAERETYCIDLIQKGALYGGQTLCGNPPLAYYTGYLLSISFGNQLQIATFILMMTLASTALLLLLLHLQPKTFLEQLLYGTFFIIILTYSTLDFATILSLFFTTASFFLIQKQKKYFLAGICLALALAAKIITLLFIIPLLICIIFAKHTKKKPYTIKKILPFLSPILTLTLILYTIHPFIFDYIFTAHTILHPHWSFSGATAYALKNFNIQHFIILFLNTTALLALLRKNIDALFLLPIGFWHVYITKTNSIFETGEPLFTSFFTYYFLLFFPFLLILLFSLGRTTKHKKSNKTFLTITIIFFIYFGLILGASSNSIVKQAPEKPPEIQKLLKNFYATFTHTGTILATEKYLHLIPSKYKNNKSPLNVSKILHPSNFGYGDPNYGPGIAALPIYNKSAYNPKLIKDKKEFSAQLSTALTLLNTTQPEIVITEYQNAYYLVLSGSLTTPTALQEKYPVLKKPYCKALVPVLIDTKNGEHSANYFYKNTTECTHAKNQVKNFVTTHFDKFCAFDETIANKYSQITKLNNATSNKTCSSGAHNYDPPEIKTKYTTILIITFFIITTLLAIRRRPQLNIRYV